MQQLQGTAQPVGGYDADTEILTREGWKLFRHLTDDDEVATRSEAGEFQWQKPRKRHCYRYDGDLVELQNRYMDLLIAPGQRLLVRRPAAYLRKQKAQDFKDWHIRLGQYFAANPQAAWEIPATSSSWRGSGPDEFILADVNNGRGTSPGIRMPIKYFCRFLGIFLAEGCVCDRRLEGTGRRDVVIEVSQSAESRHLSEIRSTLADTGMNWKYRDGATCGKFTCTSAVFGRWLKANCGHGAENKRIPSWVKDLPVGQLEMLLRGMMIGDGHWRVASDLQMYGTSSERLADDVQEIFQKLGMDAGKHVYFGKDHWKAKRVRPQYRIEERIEGGGAHRLPVVRLREYHGNVYYVTVPNGIVYVRRNGKHGWCG